MSHSSNLTNGNFSEPGVRLDCLDSLALSPEDDLVTAPGQVSILGHLTPAEVVIGHEEHASQ